jgi:hypothetical protein
MEQLPVTIPPGVVRNSTPAGVGAHWYDSHLMRWVSGRLRPILGWERIRLITGLPPNQLPAIAPTTIRAIHQWVDQDGFERQAILCERHLFVVEGSTVIDVTPLEERNTDNTVRYEGGIKGPASSAGGYGGGLYDQGTYDTGRAPRASVNRIGEVWRLRNFGEHLLAMASSDGRLLRWIPGTPRAERVKGQVSGGLEPKWAPENNRTFEVTPERYVMLFGMGGKVNAFGWCDQENVEDWNFGDPLNTAGFYEVEPVSRIIDARVARYTTIFWTVQGTYVIEYKALPYIYTYSYLGAQAGPLSGLATAAFAGNIIWPAADGFWMFDGSSVTQVACPVLDWFQQTQNPLTTRMYTMGCFYGAASEVWWCFPDKDHTENNRLIVYNFEERWWSLGYLKRTCGYPGTMANPPLLANHYAVFRHERGYSYEGEDLPWIRSGQLSPDGAGKVRSTTKQIIVDTDAPLNAVTYQIIATKGRFQGAKEYVKPPKLASERKRDGQGKIDYRITGRDFALKMQSTIAGVPWSFGQGAILLSPRGRTDTDTSSKAP